MNINHLLRQIAGKCRYLNRQLLICHYKRCLYQEVERNKGEKVVYLFSNPTHSNLGDQAQTVCILRWFATNFSQHKVICVPMDFATPKLLNLIETRLRSEDILFVHSGYLIYNQHPHLPFICEVVKRYKNNKIVIFPQTVLLTDKDVILRTQEAFNTHRNLILMCRDEVSLSNAQKLFTCRTLLFPDFVTSLIGNSEFAFGNKRADILFVLRNDGEKYYSDEELNNLKSKFTDLRIDTTDTTIQLGMSKWISHRDDIIKDYLECFSHYRLVITDRYHGAIFSQIVSTPTIVLSSADNKLSSGVKWFPKEQFTNYIAYANDLDEAYQLAICFLRQGEIPFNESKYFNENYWNKLYGMIMGINIV